MECPSLEQISEVCNLVHESEGSFDPFMIRSCLSQDEDRSWGLLVRLVFILFAHTFKRECFLQFAEKVRSRYGPERKSLSFENTLPCIGVEEHLIQSLQRLRNLDK